MAKNNVKKDTLQSQNYQQSITDMLGEYVQEIALTELKPPDCHPFRVLDDDEMTRLVESVKRFGVREPGLARPIEGGGYELLCGNRRRRACEILGLAAMPVIVRKLDDSQAVIAMVDSNIQSRERILPSEKAFAYKMKMDALNHKGIKADKLSCEAAAEQTGESVTQLFRFVRLTELDETLLDKTDKQELALTTAVELSYLSYEEQFMVADCMEKYCCRPSLSQAMRLKKLKKAGTLTADTVENILAEDKKVNRGKPAGSLRFRRFFPPEYSAKQIEVVIYELLRNWQKQNSITK